MSGAEDLSTVSQKYNQQILGRFEGEENDESVGINFDGYRVR